jgi:hypothetical protein
MADPRLTDARLDRLLAAAADIPYPSTPNLAARWVPPERRAGAVAGRWWLAAAAALAAVVLALAVPGAREGIAEFFGLVRGQRFEPLPEASATASTPSEAGAAVTPAVAPTATPAAVATPPDVLATGVPATLAEVIEALGHEPLLPEGYGDPLGLYLFAWGGNRVLVAQYRDFDLWQSRLVGFVGKGLPESAIVGLVGVDGEPAYWVEGGGRVVTFHDGAGRPIAESRRQVDRNTLIWDGDGTYYRIETDLDVDEALAIARALR